jgi:DNA invertase Pin-like site-specific DNA recombinase
VAVSRDNPGIISPREGYPEEFRNRVRRAFREEKKTRTELANEFGIGLQTVRDWVGPKPEWKETRDRYHKNIDTVRAMHWDGNTYHHIARVTGIPVSTVWEYINHPWKYANH